MTEKPKLTNVTMVRENLDGIPEFPLPEGYSIRLFRAGDEEEWERIWISADSAGQAHAGLFAEEFGKDMPSVPERMFFVVDASGRAIATATSWYRTADDKSSGVVHWVAVERKEQGRGLSKPLLSAVLARLKGLGYDRARLVTQTVRLVAIRLYSAFGFVPLIETDEDAANWSGIKAELGETSRQ